MLWFLSFLQNTILECLLFLSQAGVSPTVPTSGGGRPWDSGSNKDLVSPARLTRRITPSLSGLGAKGSSFSPPRRALSITGGSVRTEVSGGGGAGGAARIAVTVALPFCHLEVQYFVTRDILRLTSIAILLVYRYEVNALPFPCPLSCPLWYRVSRRECVALILGLLANRQ